MIRRTGFQPVRERRSRDGVRPVPPLAALAGEAKASHYEPPRSLRSRGTGRKPVPATRQPISYGHDYAAAGGGKPN